MVEACSSSVLALVVFGMVGYCGAAHVFSIACERFQVLVRGSSVAIVVDDGTGGLRDRSVKVCFSFLGC